MPGPASREGEAGGPSSCDSARVYLDVFTGPLPVYRTHPGAAPEPLSSGPAAQAAPAPLPSPPSWEQGILQRKRLAATLRAALVCSHPFAVLPPLRPDTGAQGSPLLYPFGVNQADLPNAFPILPLTTMGSCQEQGNSSSACPVPMGSLGWSPPSTPRRQEQRLSREGLREAKQVSLAACHWLSAAGQSAGGAQTWGGKDCKTAKEGKRRGWSMSGVQWGAPEPR